MGVSKEYKKQIVNWYVSMFRKLNISDKTFGFFMRAFHVNLPIYCVIFLIYGNQFMNICTLIFLVCASISFITFDGCILSMIENKVCNDDFTIADPFLELAGWEKNTKNRFNMTLIVGLTYYITVGIIYYVRFL